MGCMFKTSLCPNQCGHATDFYKFEIVGVDVTVNPESSQAKFCSPCATGTINGISGADMGAFVGVANELCVGDTVTLDWNHDYVTRDGCGSPERPVTNLAMFGCG